MITSKEIINKLKFVVMRRNLKSLTISISILLSISTSSSGSNRAPSCDLQCRNNGYCIRLSKSEMISDKKRLKPPMKCICPNGNRGIICDMNKACSKEKETSNFAKQICLKGPITEYCNNGIDDAINKNCFCTNGGACLDYKLPNDECSKCDCPNDFGGTHCEFYIPSLSNKKMIQKIEKQKEIEQLEAEEVELESYTKKSASTSDESNLETEEASIENIEEQEQMHPVFQLALFICMISGLVYLVTTFIEYNNRKYEDTMMEDMEKFNIDSDDVTVCDGNITKDRTGYNPRPPTDVIIELTGKSQRRLSLLFTDDDNNNNNNDFNIDDDDNEELQLSNGKFLKNKEKIRSTTNTNNELNTQEPSNDLRSAGAQFSFGLNSSMKKKKKIKVFGMMRKNQRRFKHSYSSSNKSITDATTTTENSQSDEKESLVSVGIV